MNARGAGVLLVLSLASLAGCVRAPSPLTPAWRGAIGRPNRGVLASGTEVRTAPGTLRFLRTNGRGWAVPRFAKAIERAAAEVARQKPGAALCVGDLSPREGGGPLPPHLSHRSGIDADLLLYVTTLDGAPVESPGFVHFGPDGLAQDEDHDRWLRLDVEREWLLVEALIEDPDARVQWIFVSDVVASLLLDWAVARGESFEALRRAQQVMHQPSPGGVHDDHIHVRTACSADEVAEGCEPTGPRRAWLPYDLLPIDDDDDDAIASTLMRAEALP